MPAPSRSRARSRSDRRHRRRTTTCAADALLIPTSPPRLRASWPSKALPDIASRLSRRRGAGMPAPRVSRARSRRPPPPSPPRAPLTALLIPTSPPRLRASWPSKALPDIASRSSRRRGAGNAGSERVAGRIPPTAATVAAAPRAPPMALAATDAAAALTRAPSVDGSPSPPLPGFTPRSSARDRRCRAPRAGALVSAAPRLDAAVERDSGLTKYELQVRRRRPRRRRDAAAGHCPRRR